MVAARTFEEIIMTNVASDPARFLKRVFLLDAATCAACFLLFVVGAAPLATAGGLPPALVSGAGWVLLPVAALFAWLGTRAAPPALLCWVAIVANLLWAAESFATIGMLAPTPFGVVLIAGQALGVFALALLEIAGLRMMRLALAR